MAQKDGDGPIELPPARKDNPKYKEKEEALRSECGRRDQAARKAIEEAINTWQTADAARHNEAKARAELEEGHANVEHRNSVAEAATAKEQTAAAALDEVKEKLKAAKQATSDAKKNAVRVAQSTEEAAAALQEARMVAKQATSAMTTSEKSLAAKQDTLRAALAEVKWATREDEKSKAEAAGCKAAEEHAQGVSSFPRFPRSAPDGALIESSPACSRPPFDPFPLWPLELCRGLSLLATGDVTCADSLARRGDPDR